MNCPNCKSDQLVVVDSRPHPDHVFRRRKCLICDHRFNTVELEKVAYEKVVKRANTVEKLKRMIKTL